MYNNKVINGWTFKTTYLNQYIDIWFSQKLYYSYNIKRNYIKNFVALFQPNQAYLVKVKLINSAEWNEKL